MSIQYPPGQFPQRTKQVVLTYDAVSINATIPVAGSVSSTIDLDGWTQFSILSVPSGTLLGGTSYNFWGAASPLGPFYPLYGTSGTTQQTIQMGSTVNGIYGPVTIIEPVRYLQLVAPGTQSAAQTFTFLMK